MEQSPVLLLRGHAQRRGRRRWGGPHPASRHQPPGGSDGATWQVLLLSWQDANGSGAKDAAPRAWPCRNCPRGGGRLDHGYTPPAGEGLLCRALGTCTSGQGWAELGHLGRPHRCSRCGGSCRARRTALPPGPSLRRYCLGLGLYCWARVALPGAAQEGRTLLSRHGAGAPLLRLLRPLLCMLQRGTGHG